MTYARVRKLLSGVRQFITSNTPFSKKLASLEEDLGMNDPHQTAHENFYNRLHNLAVLKKLEMWAYHPHGHAKEPGLEGFLMPMIIIKVYWLRLILGQFDHERPDEWRAYCTRIGGGDIPWDRSPLRALKPSKEGIHRGTPCVDFKGVHIPQDRLACALDRLMRADEEVLTDFKQEPLVGPERQVR